MPQGYYYDVWLTIAQSVLDLGDAKRAVHRLVLPRLHPAAALSCMRRVQAAFWRSVLPRARRRCSLCRGHPARARAAESFARQHARMSVGARRAVPRRVQPERTAFAATKAATSIHCIAVAAGPFAASVKPFNHRVHQPHRYVVVHG